MKTEKKSISFEPKNVKQLSSFLEANKGNYHEIWIVLTKKEHANPQHFLPRSPDRSHKTWISRQPLKKPE